MWPFRTKHVTPLTTALKDGRLVNMQLPPFRQFNEIMQNEYVLVMTKAAYQAVVELPGEPKRNAKVPAHARWGIVYLSFIEAFKGRKDDPVDGVFDVNVMTPDGFQFPKTVKVVVEHDFDGEEAFVFMLPEETWPLAGCS